MLLYNNYIKRKTSINKNIKNQGDDKMKTLLTVSVKVTVTVKSSKHDKSSHGVCVSDRKSDCGMWSTRTF